MVNMDIAGIISLASFSGLQVVNSGDPNFKSSLWKYYFGRNSICENLDARAMIEILAKSQACSNANPVVFDPCYSPFNFTASFQYGEKAYNVVFLFKDIGNSHKVKKFLNAVEFNHQGSIAIAMKILAFNCKEFPQYQMPTDNTFTFTFHI